MRENAQKLRFVRQAVQSHDRFWKNDPLDTDLVGAVDWCAARTPEQVGESANQRCALTHVSCVSA